MFSPTALRKRLRENIEALSALEDDIPNAAEEEGRALAAYRRAQLRLSTLIERQGLLTADSEVITRALNTMATFPPELLSIIFTFANTEDDDLSAHDEPMRPYFVNRARVALPWRLGLVCRHWRDTVSGTPGAWSYIGLSYRFDPQNILELDAPSVSRRIGLQRALELSGSAPLDVAIWSLNNANRPAHPGADGLSEEIAGEHNFFHSRFRLLHENMHRIRSLHVTGIVLPPLRHHESFVPMYQGLINLLRTPTPSLVELRVQMYGRIVNAPLPANFWYNFPAEPCPMLLPAAPNLRVLTISGAAIVCRRPHAVLPSLRKVQYTQRKMHSVHLHDLLAIAPQLEWVTLNVDRAIEDGNVHPEAPDPAPQVRTLEVLRGKSFGLLEDGARLLPNLTHLVFHDISELSVTPALSRRLTRIGFVHQDDLHEHLDTLRMLHCIEHVDFGNDVSLRDDLFFAPLCASRDPMWPKLRVVAISGAEMVSVDKDGVLRLLRARNLPRDASEDSRRAAPVPIEEVNLDHGDLPEWVTIQIREILPERNSHAA